MENETFYGDGLISMNADTCILTLTKTKPTYHFNLIYRKRRLKWKGWN